MKRGYGHLSCALALILCGGVEASGFAQLKPPAVWRVTEREIFAAQDGLYRRGYLKTRPNGALNQETLNAIRRYQVGNGMKETGKLDFETYSHLGLRYPASADIMARMPPAQVPETPAPVQKPAQAETRANVRTPVKLPVRTAPIETVQKTQAKPRAEVEPTKSAGPDVASMTKSAAAGLGRATARTSQGLARGAKNTTNRAGGALFNRNEEDLRFEVGRELDDYPPTRGWPYAVKGGQVTLTAPSKNRPEVGQIVSNIRKIAGVKSVVVITR